MRASGATTPAELVNEVLTLYSAIIDGIYQGNELAKMVNNETGEMLDIVLPGFVYALNHQEHVGYKDEYKRKNRLSIVKDDVNSKKN